MEWGETAESLDLAINMTRYCGQLAIGAYHTGGKRLVDVQQLNVKAIGCLSTHPREEDLNRQSCANALQMLAEGWNYKNAGTLQQVKAMGYEGVEFAGLFGKSTAEVKKLCEQDGLVPISAHVPFVDMMTVQDAGTKWVVVEQDKPSMDKSSLECAKMSIEYLKGIV